MPTGSTSINDRLQALEERIGQALERSGRKRSEITVVAVTKKFSAEIIRDAYATGLRDFGENYVQEFAGKYEGVRDLVGARYHLIGHLQSNKARVASELFQSVQTIDSVKLLNRLDAVAEERGVDLQVLIELKLSDEANKTGASEEELPALVDAGRACRRVTLTGLMTVPPWSEDPETSRPYFKKLCALGRQYGLSNLSMGMSGDFEVGIEEGATIIRVGTALFGARPKPVDAVAVLN